MMRGVGVFSIDSSDKYIECLSTVNALLDIYMPGDSK